MPFLPNNIVAYFQPILSADSYSVPFYEVLGRFVDSDLSVKSLGPFFSNAGTTDEDAFKIDRMVRRYAMKKNAEEKRTEYLFINIRLAWLEKFAYKPGESPIVHWAQEFDIAPDRIVIEVTEEEFNTNAACIDVLAYCKKAGFRIALDDYGKNASNIDRLAQLCPDIIKISIDCVHKSETSLYYREYLKAISNFANAVGIEVLYKGIETQQQLDICMSSKKGLYQGFLIAPPQASMRDAVVNRIAFPGSTENIREVQHKRIFETRFMTPRVQL
jgi:EAL domain-containing protein (putative c-di-GMP-specific phosphodiesterase class I)